ncbi:hypothetical protein [Paenibacillus sp. ACRRY]|uniref:hypothetical protein n=1 Tax=Paenibacillus sp. ACRRY TaxID=2918208 RepID=UPI001EF40EE1|nr:hypothetical protein [Paenibacillus sp. ACRRY]MCG7384946.1 hypothetical protein [Paenibacillus sp. ACRRY]
MKSHDHIYYIALSYHIPKPKLHDYHNHLRTHIIPAYELKIGISINAYNIYTHKFTTEKHGDFPSWNMLHVIELTNKDQAAAFMQELNQQQPFPEAIPVRQELLISTPNSNYPIQTQQTRRRWLKPLQVVEHVDVQLDQLDAFRKIMIQRNGPAMNFILSERKWCHSFYALETEEVWLHHPDYPLWNQLHIIALYPEAPFMYKKDFAQGLAQAAQISFDDNMNQLKQIRTMRYKTVSSLIPHVGRE